jgi:hypothetical protein
MSPGKVIKSSVKGRIKNKMIFNCLRPNFYCDISGLLKIFNTH